MNLSSGLQYLFALLLALPLSWIAQAVDHSTPYPCNENAGTLQLFSMKDCLSEILPEAHLCTSDTQCTSVRRAKSYKWTQQSKSHKAALHFYPPGDCIKSLSADKAATDGKCHNFKTNYLKGSYRWDQGSSATQSLTGGDDDQSLDARDVDQSLDARDLDQSLDARDDDQALDARDVDQLLNARDVDHPLTARGDDHPLNVGAGV